RNSDPSAVDSPRGVAWASAAGGCRRNSGKAGAMGSDNPEPLAIFRPLLPVLIRACTHKSARSRFSFQECLLLPPKPTSEQTSVHVRFVPEADITTKRDIIRRSEIKEQGMRLRMPRFPSYSRRISRRQP